MWTNIGNWFIFIWGSIGVFTGYMACVHDWSHKFLNMFMMCAIQTSWVAYITGMVATGRLSKLSAENNVFIPLAYSPTDADVNFMAAMGILGIMAYSFAFVGSSAFMVWCLHAYTTGVPETRSGNYYAGRMWVYSGVLFWAGFLQFLLGCYCQSRFDMDDLKYGPVTAAFWVITYPGINIFIGLFQMFNGVWGMARIGGWFDFNPNFFQFSMGIQWIFVLYLQIVTSLAYNGPVFAMAAPTLAAYFLPLSLMPAYLDYKRTSLPATFSDDYYVVSNDSEGPSEGIEKTDDKKEAAVEQAAVEQVEGESGV